MRCDPTDNLLKTSRQLALAAHGQPLFGLELGHAEQVVQHVQLVALGEFAKSNHRLGNKGDGLIGAAFPRWIIAPRLPLPG